MAVQEKHPAHQAVANLSQAQPPYSGALTDPLQELNNPVPLIRFPERVRLTPEDSEGDTDERLVLYAIGRTRADILVEAERNGKIVGTLPLGGYYTHAPAVFARIPQEVLESLPH